jgi:hypothetical protein
MAKITGNEPYYPFFTWNAGGNGNAVEVDTHNGTQVFPYETGITIRQQFAMAAMQGLLSNDEHIKNDEKSYPEITADMALQYADALIEELNKTDKTE